jgi:tellurite resistance protein TehA-like permease
MAVWALNVVVFCFFSVLFLGRLLVFRDTVAPLLNHRSEPLFLGAIPMAFAVIANGFVLFFSDRISHGRMLAAACALWYVNLPVTLGTSVLFPFFIISRHENTPESMTALWLLPIVPANVAAGAAGVLSSAHAKAYAADVSMERYAGLIGPVIFIGLLL